MKILVLDDAQERLDLFIKNFKAKYPDAEVITTMTAQECINLLSSHSWDLVCLDHDLGGEHFVDPDNRNTGSEVIRYLCSNKLLEPKPKFIVHSFNNIQAPQMNYSLKLKGYDSHYIPGVWLDSIFKETFSQPD